MVKAKSKPKAAAAAKKVPEKKSGRSAKPDRGEADYAVQARKMKALLDTLTEAGGDLAEAKALKEMARRGFDIHPRTLVREAERLKVLGYQVVRTSGAEGISYRLDSNDKAGEAIKVIEGVRKSLRKAGLGAEEKELAGAVKLLKA